MASSRHQSPTPSGDARNSHHCLSKREVDNRDGLLTRFKDNISSILYTQSDEGNPGEIEGFRRVDWLKPEAKLPPSIERRVHRYMHHKDLYQVSSLTDPAFVDLINLVKTEVRVPNTRNWENKVPEKCKTLINTSAEDWERDGILVKGNNMRLKSHLFKVLWDCEVHAAQGRLSTEVPARQISPSPANQASSVNGDTIDVESYKRRAENFTGPPAKKPRSDHLSSPVGDGGVSMTVNQPDCLDPDTATNLVHRCASALTTLSGAATPGGKPKNGSSLSPIGSEVTNLGLLAQEALGLTENFSSQPSTSPLERAAVLKSNPKTEGDLNADAGRPLLDSNTPEAQMSICDTSNSTEKSSPPMTLAPRPVLQCSPPYPPQNSSQPSPALRPTHSRPPSAQYQPLALPILHLPPPQNSSQPPTTPRLPPVHQRTLIESFLEAEPLWKKFNQGLRIIVPLHAQPKTLNAAPGSKDFPPGIMILLDVTAFFRWFSTITEMQNISILSFTLIDDSQQPRTTMIRQGDSVSFESLKSFLWSYFQMALALAANPELVHIKVVIAIPLPKPTGDHAGMFPPPHRAAFQHVVDKTPASDIPEASSQPHSQPNTRSSKSDHHALSAAATRCQGSQYAHQHASQFQDSGSPPNDSNIIPATEIVVRLQIDARGKLSNTYNKSVLNPKIKEFFDWFAYKTAYADSRRLKFYFKDAWPPECSDIEQGQDNYFGLMKRDIKRKLEHARAFTPGMKEFTIVITDPEWQTSEGEEEGW